MIIVQNATELATVFQRAAHQLRAEGDLSAADLADDLYDRAMTLAATTQHRATTQTEAPYNYSIELFAWEG